MEICDSAVLHNDIFINGKRHYIFYSGAHLFCQRVPMRLDKKDAKKKTRDFLGFSSFFAVFLTYLKNLTAGGFLGRSYCCVY